MKNEDFVNYQLFYLLIEIIETKKIEWASLPVLFFLNLC